VDRGIAARLLEQAGDEILQRLRARGLAHGLLRLPRDEAQRSGHHQQHQRGSGQCPAMPLHELAAAVRHALRARQHRLALEVAVEVEGHRLDRRIAMLGALGQRLQHDVVEVAGDLARAAAQCQRARRVAVGLAQQVGRRLRGV
jgi:hypothetical protein